MPPKNYIVAKSGIILGAIVLTNVIDVLQQCGAVITLALITILLAEVVDLFLNLSRWATYPVLIIADVVALIVLGLSKPFNPILGYALKWLGIVMTLSSLTMIIDNYVANSKLAKYQPLIFLLLVIFDFVVILTARFLFAKLESGS